MSQEEETSRVPNTRPYLAVSLIIALMLISFFWLLVLVRPGDPFNIRLRALRHDPAMDLIPKGATIVREHAAPSGHTPFTSLHKGPTVSHGFQFRGPPRDVQKFFGSALPQLGWRFEKSSNIGVYGKEIYYAKDFGWEGRLRLTLPGRLGLHGLTLSAPPFIRDSSALKPLVSFVLLPGSLAAPAFFIYRGRRSRSR